MSNRFVRIAQYDCCVAVLSTSGLFVFLCLLQGNAQKTQVLHDVHLASVKYYATMHDVVEDAFEMGYLVFRWPSDTMTLELILRHSDGWKLQPKLAEGFLRPVLYIARAEERIRIVKASEGRLMTGATTPRRTVLSAIDSRALFEWNDAVLQTYTTAPSKSLKAFSLNVQKLDHSSFLSRVLFPPDRGPVNDDTYRVGYDDSNGSFIFIHLFR